MPVEKVAREWAKLTRGQAHHKNRKGKRAPNPLCHAGRPPTAMRFGNGPRENQLTLLAFHPEDAYAVRTIITEPDETCDHFTFKNELIDLSRVLGPFRNSPEKGEGYSTTNIMLRGLDVLHDRSLLGLTELGSTFKVTVNRPRERKRPSGLMVEKKLIAETERADLSGLLSNLLGQEVEESPQNARETMFNIAKPWFGKDEEPEDWAVKKREKEKEEDVEDNLAFLVDDSDEEPKEMSKSGSRSRANSTAGERDGFYPDGACGDLLEMLVRDAKGWTGT